MKLTVPSRPKWTDTGLDVAAGDRLRLSASGQWRDWTIDTGPDGFDRAALALLERWRRVPKARWFALCGALERDDATAFVIGIGCDWTAPASGRLSVFANDVPWAYWNNKGAIELSIETL